MRARQHLSKRLQELGKYSMLLCLDAQKYIRKSYLTARLFLMAQGDRVEAVGFCQRRNRSSSIIQHAFSFMK